MLCKLKLMQCITCLVFSLLRLTLAQTDMKVYKDLITRTTSKQPPFQKSFKRFIHC